MAAKKRKGSGRSGGNGSRRTPTLESKPGGGKRESLMPQYPSYRSKSKKRAPTPGFLKRTLKKTAIYGTLGGALLLTYINFTLPDIDGLNKFTKAPSILIKSEDGQIIGSFGDIYGDYITFDQMPQSLTDAVIATEDRNFYHHFGVDPLGLLRATYANIRAHRVVQGGSTITQQVAKNVFLTPERSFMRKLREMVLAVKLERRFSKQDIISIYLNRVYFGTGSYGIDAAAHRYFDKSARDLTLPESAIIAGLLKAPSRYSPSGNPSLARARAEQVLLNMQDAGYLTKEQTERARADLVKSMKGRKPNSQSTMYFADWIADQLPEYVGNVKEDLVVTSTLRPQLQTLAEKALTGVMDKEGESHDASQAALVAMTPDGAVRAMLGGRSYGESQYNRATQSQRQPGSSFKLFVYLAGLEAGFTPDTMVEDKQVSVKVAGGYWSPKNYTGRYQGEMPLKDAVMQSLNTVAVQVALQSGLDRVVNMAHRLGVSSDIDPLPSLALGATEVSLIEMTGAYAHLAAEGAIVVPYGITAIDTSHGEPVYRRQNGRIGVALSRTIVNEMNEMLLGVVEGGRGTGRAARIGRPVAGKTGTTSDYKDAWFMGYTPDLVAGVWVGNDDNTEMKKVTGGSLPASIWHDFMQPALAGTPVSDIPTSGGGPAPLPWQEGGEAPAYPQQPGDHARNAPAPSHDRDVELGPSFWDKLLGRR